MKKLFFCLVMGLMITVGCAAQILEPVHWKTEQKGDSVLVSATIDDGWALGIMSIGTQEFNPWEEPEYKQSFSMMMAKDAILPIRYHVCDDMQCLAPAVYMAEAKKETAKKEVKPEIKDTLPLASAISDTIDSASTESVVDVVPTSVVKVSSDTETPVQQEERTIWWIFMMGVLAGLLAIFTPCVWPIIPMTVSFFIKRSGGQRGERTGGAIRDAILYGLSIIVIYVGLGLLVTLIFGASALNAMSTNATVNIIFFLVLVVFAASFFGAFELTLPSSWSTKMNSKSRSTAGFLSVLFMAFTLVIVSFSCTGPIIGTLLVEAAGKNLMAPAMGMLGFAIALALPFSLFAMFPSVLSKLPKSGGWMNTFKVSLAFLELALSLKFLSVADMAYGWHILDREVFLSLWIIIFVLLGLYLLGLIRFAGDDEEHQTTSVPRLFLAIASLAFAMYMVPGLWGAPLKAISAFAPPRTTQDWVLTSGQVDGATQTSQLHVESYEEALRLAKETGKPILLDFTGYGCVNCRKMEEMVLENQEVKSRLSNYIMVSLYVDEKRKREDGSESIGDYNSRIQREQYGSNAQPFFVQLDKDGNQQGQAQAFTTDPQEFIDWLKY